MRKVLKRGFDLLCTFSVDANSLILISTLASLLYGLISFDTRNQFVYTAAVLFFTAVGEYVEETAYNKYSNEKSIADKLSAIAIILALIAFALVITLNLISGAGLYKSLARSFLMLVFICPVTLGLVCRCASMIVLYKAQEKGVFLQKVYAYEKLGKVREVICEQRGIVTDDEYSLYDIYASQRDKTELLSIAATMEKRAAHPFAGAILEACRSIGVSPKTADNCFEICGRGVGAQVEGSKYFLGNKKLFKEKRIRLPEIVKQMDFGGYLPLYMSENGEFCGIFVFENKKKRNADEALAKIKKLGKRCTLIAEDERKDLKENFDVTVYEREKVLQEFKKGVKINAMVISRKYIANADVIATTQMTDNADVILGKDGLYAALYALALGKKTHSLIKIVFALQFVFVALFATFAAFGITVAPWLWMAVYIVPIALLLTLKKFDILKPVSKEDDIMFGKINYTMVIDGMNCAHCSARVKTTLESIKGVSAKISLEEKNARIKCSAKTTAEELTKAVADAGFTVVSTERV
ncbi:MAG: cation transporter [Clostridia bacterium]|nr:cation transporter [Clostridia bacterium]